MKTLYLNPNKIDGYWTSSIAQKLTECNHDINFHAANLQDSPDTNSIWIYGLASITADADAYACMKPGHKGGELLTIDKSWSPSQTTAESDQFLALEFHYNSYEVYDYKSKERNTVEPCPCEFGIATILQSKLKENQGDGSKQFAITLMLTGFPKQLADQIKGKPLPLDPNDQMAMIVVQSLVKPLEESKLGVELPAFSPPNYGRGGGSGKRYKSPGERLKEREDALKTYVVGTFTALGYNSDLVDGLTDALATYPLNPLTLETIVTIAFSSVSTEQRSKEQERLSQLLSFAVTLL